MKLKEWADKVGVNYATAYRWFKNQELPVSAYQTSSGTIIVEDDGLSENNLSDNNVMALFLRKTVEYSKNNSSIEDFAAYLISNFTFKPIANDNPKYSRNKPKPEEAQKHFQKFLNKGEKPKPNMFLIDPNLVNDNDLTLDASLLDKSPSEEEIVDMFRKLENAVFEPNSEQNTVSGPTGAFKPTQKELEDVEKVTRTVEKKKRNSKKNGDNK